MARTFVALLAFLAASLIGLPAEAQWKWRDKGGHVQYSDLPPPPGTAESDILTRPSAGMQRRPVQSAAVAPSAMAGASGAASAASAVATARTVDPELEAKRKKTEADAAAKAKADQDRVAALRADNCGRAKAQMNTLKSGIRIAQTNAKTGEREYLDDKQRADETRRTEAVIASDCK